MVGNSVIDVLYWCTQQQRELFSSLVTSCGDDTSHDAEKILFSGREKLVILTWEAHISESSWKLGYTDNKPLAQDPCDFFKMIPVLQSKITRQTRLEGLKEAFVCVSLVPGTCLRGQRTF